MSVIVWNAPRELHAPRFIPAADIAETEGGYIIELELPGFAASDVEVNVQDGVLRVAGERTPPPKSQAADQPTREIRRVHRAERAVGDFARHFRLPKDADAAAVRATACNGVLTLEIARLAEAAPRSIEVKVA